MDHIPPAVCHKSNRQWYLLSSSRSFHFIKMYFNHIVTKGTTFCYFAKGQANTLLPYLSQGNACAHTSTEINIKIQQLNEPHKKCYNDTTSHKLLPVSMDLQHWLKLFFHHFLYLVYIINLYLVNDLTHHYLIVYA